MSEPGKTSRRQRVEPGIYARSGADGHTTYEIGWRDAQGRQRWRRVEGGIRAARAALADAHSARARGERVGADPRLRFDDAAAAWWEARVTRLRPATHSAYAASLAHLRRRFGGVRMTDITPSDVAAFIAEQQRAVLKGWTIKGQMTVLSSIFTYSARHLGLSASTPCLSSIASSARAPTTSGPSESSRHQSYAACSTRSTSLTSSCSNSPPRRAAAWPKRSDSSGARSISLS